MTSGRKRQANRVATEEKMATAAIDEGSRQTSSSMSVKAGWVLSALAIVFLGSDAAAKLLVPAIMAAYTPPQLRIPSDPSFYRVLGTILAISTALYAFP